MFLQVWTLRPLANFTFAHTTTTYTVRTLLHHISCLLLLLWLSLSPLLLSTFLTFYVLPFFSAPNSPIHTASITIKVPSSRLPSKKQLTFQTRTTFKSLPNSAPQPCSTTTAGRFICPLYRPPAGIQRPTVRPPTIPRRKGENWGRPASALSISLFPRLVRPMENCWANKEGEGIAGRADGSETHEERRREEEL